jgi:hypothetical protein
MVQEERMTWIGLGREMLLGRFVIAALLCAQAGVLSALAVAILPFLVEVLQLRSCRKHRHRAGEWTC